MPAVFFYLDGHHESGTVELDVRGDPPNPVERDARHFVLDGIGRAGFVLYAERRSSHAEPHRISQGG